MVIVLFKVAATSILLTLLVGFLGHVFCVTDDDSKLSSAILYSMIGGLCLSVLSMVTAALAILWG